MKKPNSLAALEHQRAQWRERRARSRARTKAAKAMRVEACLPTEIASLLPLACLISGKKSYDLFVAEAVGFHVRALTKDHEKIVPKIVEYWPKIKEYRRYAPSLLPGMRPIVVRGKEFSSEEWTKLYQAYLYFEKKVREWGYNSTDAILDGICFSLASSDGEILLKKIAANKIKHLP